MARAQITLYGEHAARFEQLKERVGEERPGSEPGNAELVRVLMDLAESGDRLEKDYP
jgi:hypothetical protein